MTTVGKINPGKLIRKRPANKKLVFSISIAKRAA
jgi:hypothetical protein